MRTLVFPLLLLLPVLGRAGDLQGDIYGIDTATSSITVSANTAHNCAMPEAQKGEDRGLG